MPPHTAPTPKEQAGPQAGLLLYSDFRASSWTDGDDDGDHDGDHDGDQDGSMPVQAPDHEGGPTSTKSTAAFASAFLTKLFEAASNPATDHAISWSEEGDAIIIGDPEASNHNPASKPRPRPKREPEPEPKPEPEPNPKPNSNPNPNPNANPSPIP